MKTVLSVLIFTVLVSCSMLQEKNEYQFVYHFENPDDTMQKSKTIEVLSKRLKAYNVDFEFDNAESEEILLTIKADTINKDRINNLMTNKGKLEFWECYNNSNDIFESIVRYDDSLNQGALEELIVSPDVPYGSIIFYCSSENLEAVLEHLNEEAFKTFFKSKFKHLKFLQEQPSDIETIGFYAVKSNQRDEALVTGNNITKAFQILNYIGRPTVSIEMDEVGAKQWEHLTNEAFVNGTQIAITVNDIVYSAPGVTAGPITGGKSEVSGNYTLEEAQDLAAILNGGSTIPELKLARFLQLKNQ